MYARKATEIELDQHTLFDMAPAQRPPRAPDLIWNTMEELFGPVEQGTNAHARRNKAIKDLKLLGAEPEDLPRALASFRASWPRAYCTDIALATHFPLLRPKRVAPPCPDCGVGGGMHAIDCRAVTTTTSEH